MRTAAKVGIVAGGYAGAFLVATAAVYIRLLATNTPQAQASSGMYAFGDSLVFVFAFGIAALVPTGLALYFLRPIRWFWRVTSMGAMVFAATGVASAVLFWSTRSRPPDGSWITLAAALGFERTFVAPLITVAFLVAACFAPEKRPRWAFVLAAVFEAAAAAPFLIWIAYHVVRAQG